MGLQTINRIMMTMREIVYVAPTHVTSLCQFRVTGRERQVTRKKRKKREGGAAENNGISRLGRGM